MTIAISRDIATPSESEIGPVLKTITSIIILCAAWMFFALIFGTSNLLKKSRAVSNGRVASKPDWFDVSMIFAGALVLFADTLGIWLWHNDYWAYPVAFVPHFIALAICAMLGLMIWAALGGKPRDVLYCMVPRYFDREKDVDFMTGR